MKNIHCKPMMILALWAAMITACKKLIDIPPNPPTEITQAQQFADSATTMTAMAGVYSYPPGAVNGFTFNDGLLSIYSGLSSDELSSAYSYASTDVEFYDYGINPMNNNLSSLWSNPYNGMYTVNAALSGIAASGGLSASLKLQLTGELKVVRALYYFDLVNLFGAVPLVTTTDYTITGHIPRTSADSIYLQILTDLTDAQQVLPVTYPSPGHYRPNLYIVKAFLAKVYLYQQNWQAAFDAADTVISSGLYALEPDPDNVFLDGSQEAIWQLPATGEAQVTQEATNYVPETSGTTPSYPLTSFLVNAFEPGDLRMQDWVGTAVVDTGSGSGSQNLYYPYKYKNLTPAAPTTEDFMIFRLGEQYLIHAEAAAELGKLGVALSDLNTVRSRAGLAASTAATQVDLLTAIMHERQVELFCEWGNRWFDLKRTGQAGTVLSAEKSGWQPYDVLYPVPYTQLLLDNLLTQNPGYN